MNSIRTSLRLSWMEHNSPCTMSVLSLKLEEIDPMCVKCHYSTNNLTISFLSNQLHLCLSAIFNLIFNYKCGPFTAENTSHLNLRKHVFPQVSSQFYGFEPKPEPVILCAYRAPTITLERDLDLWLSLRLHWDRAADIFTPISAFCLSQGILCKPPFNIKLIKTFTSLSPIFSSNLPPSLRHTNSISPWRDLKLPPMIVGTLP